MPTLQRLVAGFLALGLLCAGCGQEGRPRVEGKVTFNGAPAADQTLVLVYDQGEQTFTKPFFLKEDGSFAGEVPKPGTYKVVIEPPRAAQEGRLPEGTATLAIPPKYRSAETTDLTWTLEPGLNRRDFELSP